MRRKYFLFAVVLSLLVFFGIDQTGWSQTSTEQLQKRIDELEKQVNELKLLLQEQQKAQLQEKARVDKVEQKVEQSEEKVKVVSSPSILSEFKFKPYGFVKLDAAYDDSRVYPSSGNFTFYVPSEQRDTKGNKNKNDNSFSMTARQTQIGLYILAPETYSWQAKGRFEFDLYGDATTHENKANLLLRHACVELTRKNLSILAGQTSDLISPLNPNTLMYTVAWSAGNIGYRRPQLRFPYTHPFSQESKLISAIALARTKGTLNEDLDIDTKNDGEDVGYPTVQARIAYATKLFAGKESIFGISGHYGKEEIDWGLKKSTLHQKRMKTCSLNADFEIPLTNSLSIKGEGFVGYNLDDYLGGILQGINDISTAPEYTSIIKSVGGWAQITYQYKKWRYNAGLGIDDPRNDQLSSGMRSRNTFFYGNFFYNLIPPVNLCLEYSHWDTDYINKRDGTNNRIQTAVTYSW
ncbi:MAG: DcaP family trimeric outer membrane transporter [Desulfobacterota bacterium]|nr:DcaP family trimeric outer membrane transporter [Thermodesulfobacteriota bacterium]